MTCCNHQSFPLIDKLYVVSKLLEAFIVRGPRAILDCCCFYGFIKPPKYSCDLIFGYTLTHATIHKRKHDFFHIAHPLLFGDIDRLVDRIVAGDIATIDIPRLNRRGIR